LSDASQFETGLRVDDFDFDLTPELIAQQPPAERGQSRMLLMDRETGALRDSHFAALPEFLRPGDLLVLNDSRVIPARLYARRTLRREREKPTGRIEVMLTEPVLEAEVLDRGPFGDRLLRFQPAGDFFSILDQIGHMPLPPYIHRDDATTDRERYQTIFARERGSVAAPTAGLHFTPELLDTLAAKHIEIARVTLHVGLGTFAPLRVEYVDEVHLHRERYSISDVAADAVNRAIRENRRIVAVGTTVVRTLESCASHAEPGQFVARSGDTEIFISPGYHFRIVNALLTNFHLPQSSLLMLVSAFAGREKVLAAYSHAVREKYRFFSYGDCMFIS